MFNQEKVLKMIHVNLVNFYDETSKSLNQFCLLRPSALIFIHLDDYIILAPWFCAIQIFQALHPLSRQIKWTLCNILEVVALFGYKHVLYIF